MKSLIRSIIFLISIGILAAQSSAPKYSNEFMNIGAGARAIGMGNVQAGIVRDVTSGYWNPAGLMGLDTKYNTTLMHSEYFAGIAKYDYMGFATPVDSSSVIGFSMVRLGIDNIPDTRFVKDANGLINYDLIRFFSAVDYGFLLSYAKRSRMIKGLDLGVNFKVIYRKAGPFAQAWGFGLDGGVQYRRKGWVFGAMARDVTSTYNVWTFNTEELQPVFSATGNELPESSIEVTLPRILIGGGKRFIVKEKIGVMPAVEFDLTTDGPRNVLISGSPISIDPKIGMELDYKNIVYIRTGVNNIQKIKNFDDSEYWGFQPNFGIGIRIKKFYIDYAQTDLNDQTEGLNSRIISVKAQF